MNRERAIGTSGRVLTVIKPLILIGFFIVRV